MKLINYCSLVNGGIRVDTSHLKVFDIFPINIKLINKISGRVCYEVDITESMWAQSHGFIDQCYVLITDKNGNILLKKNLDNFTDGDTVENYFDIWSKTKIKSLGIVAGANDGTTGEWVDMVRENKLKAILLEPLDYAYNNLNIFYKENSNVEIFNKAITVDGGPVKFYAEQNFGGVCSTTILDQAINSAYSIDNYKEIMVESFSVIHLLKTYKPEWFHIDLEGLDFDIVSEIIKYDDLHPEIILYEHYHMKENQYKELENNLFQKGYINIKGERLNSIAIKNKSN